MKKNENVLVWFNSTKGYWVIEVGRKKINVSKDALARLVASYEAQKKFT